MDNAGGQGTFDMKREYGKILRDKFNVVILWQIPNLPESNMLDLGVWTTIQSVIEYILEDTYPMYFEENLFF